MDAVLCVKELCAGYDERSVLRELAFELSLGHWLAVMGPNGSGKSTLLYCIGGMLAPSSGEVIIGGHSLQREPRRAKQLLGFACAPEWLPGLLTGRQCLEVYAAAKGLHAIDAEILALGEELEFIHMLDVFVDTYSLGARQKLAVLLALLGDPKLIVLDEAFNGLDPASALALKKHLRSRLQSGRTSIILATHALDVIERFATRAVLLLDGRIVQDWSAADIARLSGCEDGLEAAFAAATRRGPVQRQPGPGASAFDAG